MSELSPTDTLPLLSTIDTLDDLPLLTEVVAAAVIPEGSPPDPVATLSAQLLQDKTAYQKLLARLDADWAARGIKASVPPSDDSPPSVVAIPPREEDVLPHKAESTLPSDEGVELLRYHAQGVVVKSTLPSDEGVELPTVATELCVEEIFPATAEPSAAIDEPEPAIPDTDEVSPQLLPDHSLDASRIAELEARLEQRLDEKLAALPVVGSAPTLSEEEYERVVDRLEDHLENLLHQKLEIYLARIKPSIVAQVLEELRQDAVQLLHATDDDGT